MFEQPVIRQGAYIGSDRQQALDIDAHADPDKAFYLDQLAQTRGESYAQGYAQMLKEYEPRGETADRRLSGRVRISVRTGSRLWT